MEIVVKSLDEAALFSIQVVGYGYVGAVPITVGKDISGIDSIMYEEEVKPFLTPQIRPAYFGGRHQQPCACIGATLKVTGFQILGFRHGLLKHRLCFLYVTSPDISVPLFQKEGMNPCP